MADERLPRKLAAVLYADVAGYSRVTASDEDGAHRILSDYLDLIASVIAGRHGQVMHYAGDAVLAMFEAAVDALSSALHIQAEITTRNAALPEEQRIRFRIGLHLGDVIQDRGDIYGTGVNVAARLEALAEPGGICVSESLRLAVGQKLALAYVDLGPQALKNLETPVRAYQVRTAPAGVAATPAEGAVPHTVKGVTSRGRLTKVVTLGLLLGAVGTGLILFWRQASVNTSFYAKIIPQIEQMIDAGDWEAAYMLTQDAQRSFPDAPELAELWKRFSWRVMLETDPPGATVYRRAYDAPKDRWEELGATPIKERRIPFGISRLRFERDGYLPLERLFGSGILLGDEFPVSGTALFAVVPAETYKLDTSATLPEGKVRVPGWSEVIGAEQVTFNDFFLDRTEVTNSAFQAFVAAGGYRQGSLWDPIVRDGKTLPFEEAVALFTDKTRRQGPSTWEAGDYPEGQADFPVSGVSWYEARAYARFMRQELPSVYHWRHAFDGASMRWQLPAANLEGGGPRSVKDSKSMSYVGAFDLAGNVREWLANEQEGQRMILGGSYNDSANTAMNTITVVAPALDRSPGNGFRLAITRDDAHAAELGRAPLPTFAPSTGWAEPVSDELFNAYGRAFAYEKTPLNARVEASETTRLWLRQRITFDAAYGGERMMLYLYLPASGAAPYQTVMFWPGTNAALYTSIEQLGMRLDFVLKSGRAVAFPVFKGMLERSTGGLINSRTEPVAYRDLTIQQVKDLRRSIDYLETRSDIDPSAIAYFGHSWGGTSGPTAVAHEPRIKVVIFYLGFIWPMLEPEINSINALPRVKAPTLLINGEFDSIPLDNTSQFFSLLGTRPEDKKHVIAIGGHFVPQDVLVRETLDWLDKYLGQVAMVRSVATQTVESGDQ